jgi:hypothetical protein
MNVTTEERLDRLEERQDESHAWHEVWGKKVVRWTRLIAGLWIAMFIIAPLSIGWTVERFHAQDQRACESRQESREAVRDLVQLAIGDAPRQDNPTVHRLVMALEPGGPLGPIVKC